MKKTFVLITACLLSSTPLKAGGDNPSQSGFFVGAQAGYVYLGTSMDMTSTLSGAVSRTESASHYKRSHNFIGGLHLGYLALLKQKYILGGDIEGNFDTVSIKNHIMQNAQRYTYKASRQFNLIPSFIVGAQVYDYLKIYLRLGMAISSFHYRLINHGNNEDIRTNHHSISLGFAPALVHEVKISKHCAVSIIAAYEIYEKSKTVFLSSIVVGDNADNNVLKIRPNVFSMKVGFKYYL
ncbi:MAG TPA: hypothetical protein DD412_01670 [Holosporales bacterium]|nr:hypothetical protein [Holosporales bacterium]